jgi:molybdopterin converting factor small subunit
MKYCDFAGKEHVEMESELKDWMDALDERFKQLYEDIDNMDFDEELMNDLNTYLRDLDDMQQQQ